MSPCLLPWSLQLLQNGVYIKREEFDPSGAFNPRGANTFFHELTPILGHREVSKKKNGTVASADITIHCKLIIWACTGIHKHSQFAHTCACIIKPHFSNTHHRTIIGIMLQYYGSHLMLIDLIFL